MASMNCSLQEFVPTTRARLVFLISLSTVLCMTRHQNTNQIHPLFSPRVFTLHPWSLLKKNTRASPHDGSAFQSLMTKTRLKHDKNTHTHQKQTWRVYLEGRGCIKTKSPPEINLCGMGSLGREAEIRNM